MLKTYAVVIYSDRNEPISQHLAYSLYGPDGAAKECKDYEDEGVRMLVIDLEPGNTPGVLAFWEYVIIPPQLGNVVVLKG